METTRTQSRWTAPLVLAGALALFGARPGDTRTRIAPLRLDPGRDSAALLEALDGMGPEAARKIAAARRGADGIRSAAALVLVPGIGTRRLHRWSGDLSFEEDRR
jgi:hypothetical protein